MWPFSDVHDRAVTSPSGAAARVRRNQVDLRDDRDPILVGNIFEPVEVAIAALLNNTSIGRTPHAIHSAWQSLGFVNARCIETIVSPAPRTMSMVLWAYHVQIAADDRCTSAQIFERLHVCSSGPVMTHTFPTSSAILYSVTLAACSVPRGFRLSKQRSQARRWRAGLMNAQTDQNFDIGALVRLLITAVDILTMAHALPRPSRRG